VSAGAGSRLAAAGLVLGPALFAVMLALPAPAGLTPPAQRVLALTVWMGTWWLTAAVALEVTSLLPIALLPLLGVDTVEQAAAPYANSVIFLFLGGFFLAAAMERWNLHKRIAFAIVAVVGTDARRVVLAFMLATGFLSMWISNTAAAVMMLPMGMAVLRQTGNGTRGRSPESATPKPDGLGVCIALGIAYAASIGGVGTLIGTPPNAIYAAAARQLFEADVGFGEWMATGVLIVAVLLPAVWLALTRWLYPTSGAIPGLAERVRTERAALGPLRGPERLTFWVFVLAAAAWVLREPKDLGAVTIPGLQSLAPAVSDAGIAIAAAVVLFALPASLQRREFALDWKTAERVPWGILLLFGGGLSLAEAFQTSELSRWVGGLLAGLAGQPKLVVVATVAATFVFLTDFTSNTAVAAMAMPLMAGIAEGLRLPPLLLMHVAALGCSMAFLLPVSTPPNALVFATGRVTVAQMARAGIVVDLVSIVVITVLGTWVL
jgi:sodium-dependent dicarboxylate transporter 2/3/5